MDFADLPEHAEFRREFRAWLDANLTDDLKVEDAQDQRIAPDREILQKRIAWQKRMHAAGWVGLSWPKEYGGGGAPVIAQGNFHREEFLPPRPLPPLAPGAWLFWPPAVPSGS